MRFVNVAFVGDPFETPHFTPADDYDRRAVRMFHEPQVR
jgi:hypothetical protein